MYRLIGPQEASLTQRPGRTTVSLDTRQAICETLTKSVMPYPLKRKLTTNAGNGGPEAWIANPTAAMHEAIGKLI